MNMQIDYETERELGIDYEALAVKVAIGVQCTSIGLDDITTLKTIVTMNSADPSLLNRELAELIR
mgnify:CR=1 FL=1